MSTRPRASARFGIEEEFILLDREALVPLAMTDDVKAIDDGLGLPGVVTSEYLTSQLEGVTGPAHTMADAAQQLHRLRGLIGAHAERRGAIAGAVGAPFASTRRVTVWPTPHYDEVSAQLGHITRGHEVNGLHVHVEVQDEQERVQALNRMRGWLPLLLALTGNSPFADGLPSGFASWRSIVLRRLPSSWCPPAFRDLDDYRAHVSQLIAIGTIREAASLSWAVRLSERYPTVEVRVFDAQLDAADTLFVAALCRAIVTTPDAGAPDVPIDAVDASLWIAARRGLDATVIDPTTGEIAGVWDIAARLVDLVRPALEHAGDHELVLEHLARLRADGTGARRQTRAFAERGMDGLRDLYRSGLPAD